MQKPKKVAQVSIVIQRFERARVLPIPKTESVSEWVASQHDDKGEENQADDEQDFAQGCPEFNLSVPFHINQVDDSVQDQDNGDYGTGRQGVRPEVDDNVAGRDLERYQNSLEDEEVPSYFQMLGSAPHVQGADLPAANPKASST